MMTGIKCLCPLTLALALAACNSGSNATRHGDPDSGVHSAPDSGVHSALDSGSPARDGGGDASCSTAPGPSRACAVDEFHYDDQLCGMPRPDGGGDEPGCEQVGDGQCYKMCDSDKDCTEPCRPYCRKLGLASHTDYSCNLTVTICRSRADDDCSW